MPNCDYCLKEISKGIATIIQVDKKISNEPLGVIVCSLACELGATIDVAFQENFALALQRADYIYMHGGDKPTF